MQTERGRLGRYWDLFAADEHASRMGRAWDVFLDVGVNLWVIWLLLFAVIAALLGH